MKNNKNNTIINSIFNESNMVGFKTKEQQLNLLVVLAGLFVMLMVA